MDCVFRDAWRCGGGQRAVAQFRRLVEWQQRLESRRMGYRGLGFPAENLSRGRKQPLVCRGDLRLSYIELHAASAFSFLDGASLPERLIEACHAFEMPAMALLDRDGVYGSARFHLAAKKAGIQAHVGAELSLTSGGTLPVLVLNRKGYQNLCRLLTQSKLNSPKGTATVSEEDLMPYSEGLVCLSKGERGRRGVERLVEIFGRDGVYVELQRHFVRDEEAVN